MGYWICVGIGVYVTCAIKRWGFLKTNDWPSICRGILGIPLWPVALWVIWMGNKEHEMVDIQPVSGISDGPLDNSDLNNTLNQAIQAVKAQEVENYGFPRKK